MGTEGEPTTRVPGLDAVDNRVTVDMKFFNDGGIATRLEHIVPHAASQGEPTQILIGSGANSR